MIHTRSEQSCLTSFRSSRGTLHRGGGTCTLINPPSSSVSSTLCTGPKTVPAARPLYRGLQPLPFRSLGGTPHQGKWTPSRSLRKHCWTYAPLSGQMGSPTRIPLLWHNMPPNVSASCALAESSQKDSHGSPAHSAPTVHSALGLLLTAMAARRTRHQRQERTVGEGLPLLGPI